VSAKLQRHGGSQTRLLQQQLSAASVKREKHGSPGHGVTQNSNFACLKPVFFFGIKEAMIWAGGDFYFCSADISPIFSCCKGKREGLKVSRAEQPLQGQGEGR